MKKKPVFSFMRFKFLKFMQQAKFTYLACFFKNNYKVCNKSTFVMLDFYATYSIFRYMSY